MLTIHGQDAPLLRIGHPGPGIGLEASEAAAVVTIEGAVDGKPIVFQWGLSLLDCARVIDALGAIVPPRYNTGFIPSGARPGTIMLPAIGVDAHGRTRLPHEPPNALAEDDAPVLLTSICPDGGIGVYALDLGGALWHYAPGTATLGQQPRASKWSHIGGPHEVRTLPVHDDAPAPTGLEAVLRWREVPHEFQGRLDRPCDLCELADRAAIHFVRTASPEGTQ